MRMAVDSESRQKMAEMSLINTGLLRRLRAIKAQGLSQGQLTPGLDPIQIIAVTGLELGQRG